MTRITHLLWLLAAALTAGCAPMDRGADQTYPTGPENIAPAFLAIEGEPHPGRVAEACDAARALTRKGWDEAADAPADEEALILAAEVYRRIERAVHCPEATMMTGLAFERGWLAAEEPRAAARQYFRADALALHLDDPPMIKGVLMDTETVVRSLQSAAKLPSDLFDAAATGVLDEREWAAEMQETDLPGLYEAAMRAHFGIGAPRNGKLAKELASIDLLSGDAPSNKRRRALLLITVGNEEFDRELARDYLRLAAFDGDAIAAAQLARRLVETDDNQEALSWFLFAAIRGGPLHLQEIRSLERSLSHDQRVAARQTAEARLGFAAAKRSAAAREGTYASNRPPASP